MRVEVEAKIELGQADLARLASRLRERGFEERGEERELDTYFDHPALRLAERDEVLRLREASTRAFLTYKGPRLGRKFKEREELEVEVGSARAARRLLAALGFVEVGRIDKRRRIFERAGIKVCLDEVRGLGCFAEIELVAEDGGRAEAELEKILEELELGSARILRNSYLELMSSRGRG